MAMELPEPPRPGSATYIDDVDSQSSTEASTASSSGSSVEEELVEVPIVWDRPEAQGTPSEKDSAQSSHSDYSEEQDDLSPWEVDNEDWELAHGDFTKHYNRLRQQHAAINPNQTASSSSSSRPPLPTRNVNASGISGSTRLTNPTALHGGVRTNPKAASERQDKDKSDRATQEQVLDARTRLVLSGLVNRAIIGNIERCISTGKEANVYYAPSTDDSFPRAVKIYRTSILNFRSRQAYIVGENRFRGEYASSRNPRKLIRVWAEKELRNLRRLRQGNVRSPQVMECKENVLVMEFLGQGGSASPRLKDADIPEEVLPDLYAELLVTMRRMYHTCHLIHADLSEYNLLYHDSHLYVIDVSQSVEHDHPRSFDFLRIDIRNMKDYFARTSNGSLRMLSLRRSWDFIVSEQVDGSTTDDETELIQTLSRWIETEELDETDDAVFMSSFIPRNLSEVYDPERDVDLLKAGEGEKLIYAGLTGLTEPKEKTLENKPVELDDITEALEKSTESPASEAESDDLHGTRPRGFRHEDKDAKKERKQAVKEEQRERRRHKMSKTEKQRLIKKTSGR